MSGYSTNVQQIIVHLYKSAIFSILLLFPFITSYSKSTNEDKIDQLLFKIGGESLDHHGFGSDEVSYCPTGEKPQIQIDIDRDGNMESLYFFIDISGALNCVFSKSNGTDMIKECVGINNHSNSDETVHPTTITVRFHDFDKDNIPEVIIETKLPEFNGINGEVFRLQGVGANLKNLKGLRGWFVNAGDFWGQYNIATIEDNLIHTINFRELPLEYVYINGRLRMVN